MTDLFSDDDFDIPSSAAEDELDLESLRASSARAGTLFDEELDDIDITAMSAPSSSFSLSSFTPGQRLVLAILLLFDIIAIAVGILVVAGRL
jgi:hypothetical protein